jgi:hypothetical protein
MRRAQTRVMTLSAMLLWPLFGAHRAVAQEVAKPLAPGTFRTDYSFPIRSGGEPFHFRVELDNANAVTGAWVFRQGQSEPFQNLQQCSKPLNEGLTEQERDLELLKHSDLNFDGFEDVQLLQFFANRFARSVYCIYVWDQKLERFRSAPEIPDIDPVAHPESQTITVHIDWPAGGWSDSTYRWRGNKPELIEEDGRRSANRNNCGTDYCSRLINGKMLTTAEKRVRCSDDGRYVPLVCPPASSPLSTKQPQKDRSAMYSTQNRWSLEQAGCRPQQAPSQRTLPTWTPLAR